MLCASVPQTRETQHVHSTSNAVKQHRINIKWLEFRYDEQIMRKFKFKLALTLSILKLEKYFHTKLVWKKNTQSEYVEKYRGCHLKKKTILRMSVLKELYKFEIFPKYVCLDSLLDLPKTPFQSKNIQLKYLVLPRSVNIM